MGLWRLRGLDERGDTGAAEGEGRGGVGYLEGWVSGWRVSDWLDFDLYGWCMMWGNGDL